MKAVQVRAHGGYEQLQLVELPRPVPAEGEVVVQMRATAINPLDNLMRSGKFTMGKSLPLIPGNEGVGVIASEGSDLPVGTPVMLRHAYFLPAGGTWQEEVLAPRSLVVALPPGSSELEAAAMRTAYDAAYLAMVHQGQFQPGQVLFAPGVGSSVGNAVIQLGQALGAARVITTAGSSAKAQRARELGYADVIDLTQESIRDGIARLTSKAGVDLVIDGLGGEITTQGLASLKSEGTLVLLGDAAGSEAHFYASEFVGKAARIAAHQTVRATKEMLDEAFSVYFKLWIEGRIRPVVDRTFPLEQVAEAQRYQVEGRPFGKVLLTFLA